MSAYIDLLKSKIRMNHLCSLLLVSFLTTCFCYPYLHQDWTQWKNTHSKNYNSEEEENVRLGVWQKNYQKISEHNMANKSFTVSLNEFADMTQEEFAQYYLSQTQHQSEFLRSGEVHDESVYLKSDESSDNQAGGVSGGLDYREKGYVTSVKNQGQCGSCWAFSATGALEAQYAMSQGSLVSLSEQQLVDCSYKYGNAGCNGGLMDFAFKYVKNNGVCSEADYPYLGYMWVCKSYQCSSVLRCSGYVDISAGSEDGLYSAVTNVGPVSVAIDASSWEFQFYSGGVYVDSSCSSNSLNHGVLVVGYGSSDSNYWIVKNSWGTSWGQSGYIMMARGQNNMCGIASAASYPKM